MKQDADKCVPLATLQHSMDLLSESAGFVVGQVLYSHNRSMEFCGISDAQLCSSWANHSEMGDILLPGFCDLMHCLRRMLLVPPFTLFSEMAFPRLLPSETVDKFGLAVAWPYTLISVTGEAEQGQERVFSSLSQRGYLDPVQCAPFYAWLTTQTITASSLPILVRENLGGWSYRNERLSQVACIRKSPTFLRDEYVYVSMRDEVIETRKTLILAFCQIMESLDLEFRIVVGNGCFESDQDKLTHELSKVGVCWEVPTLDVEVYLPEENSWLEVLGASLWSDRLIKAFGITCEDVRLESGCFGIGLSRLGYGVLAQAGDAALVDPRNNWKGKNQECSRNASY